jgi:hypothetical protein
VSHPSLGKLCHHECYCSAVHSKVCIVAGSGEWGHGISTRSLWQFLRMWRQEGICLTGIGVVDQHIDWSKECFRLIKQERDRSRTCEIGFQGFYRASLCSNLLNHTVG